MITHLELRKRFSDFWKARGHVEVPGIPLIPQNDPTTLFTGSGMQQLVPNLLGEPHPLGSRLFNIQDCFRSQDIEEVGDNRHDTFFEMMGNWSLGDYFKKDQLPWFFTFLTQELELDPTRLFVTVFKGDAFAPRDVESELIWKTQFQQFSKEFLGIGISEISTNLDPEKGMSPTDRIFYYGASKNWWSRAGEPQNMPIGEIGGPDSEVFFDFDPTNQNNIHEQSLFASQPCHPNCDCGRFIEIGNSVFIEYIKTSDGSFKSLPKKNVDFGGGLERMLMATQDQSDIFKIDLFKPIIDSVSYTGVKDQSVIRNLRIIADHIRSATLLVTDGINPGPNEQGYVTRRLIRRAVRAAQGINIDPNALVNTIIATQSVYGPLYEPIKSPTVVTTIMDEITKYLTTLENGKRIISKAIHHNPNLNGIDVFNLYQSIGVPSGEVAEIAKEMGATVDMSGFEEAKKAHADESRLGSEQKFKGGLADQDEQSVKYHTATHLLHQALCDVLGSIVRQEGSNITGSRLRFDFRCDHKPSIEEIAKISEIINDKIQKAIPVNYVLLPKNEADKLGSKSFFKEKYPDMVKVYYVGDSLDSAYSKEFCGGPHVANTKTIGSLEIYKVEKIGKDIYRIYGK